MKKKFFITLLFFLATIAKMFAQDINIPKDAYVFNINLMDCSSCVALLGNVKSIDKDKYEIVYVFSSNWIDDKDIIISSLKIDTLKSKMIFNDSLYKNNIINGQSSYIVQTSNVILKKDLIKNSFGMEVVNYYNDLLQCKTDTLFYKEKTLFNKSASNYYQKDSVMYFLNIYGKSLSAVNLISGFKKTYEIDKETILKTYDYRFTQKEKNYTLSLLQLGNFDVEPTIASYFVSDDNHIYLGATLPYAFEDPNGLDTILAQFWVLYKMDLNGICKGTFIFNDNYVLNNSNPTDTPSKMLTTLNNIYVKQDTLYATLYSAQDKPLDEKAIFASFKMNEKNNKINFLKIEDWRLPPIYNYIGYNMDMPIYSDDYKYFMFYIDNTLFSTENSKFSMKTKALQNEIIPKTMLEVKKEFIVDVEVYNDLVYILSSDIKNYFFTLMDINTGKVIKDKELIYISDEQNNHYHLQFWYNNPNYLLQILNKNTIVKKCINN
jgi:hypothetical protein